MPMDLVIALLMNLHHVPSLDQRHGSDHKHVYGSAHKPSNQSTHEPHLGSYHGCMRNS